MIVFSYTKIAKSCCAPIKSPIYLHQQKRDKQQKTINIKLEIMKATVLTTAEFNKKVANLENGNEWKFLGERPAIIDFFATWCGPCKMLSLILDELSEEYEGKVDFYKVDVDQESKLSELFNIRSVPSLLFIPLTGNPGMLQGALPKVQLKNTINDILLK